MTAMSLKKERRGRFILVFVEPFSSLFSLSSLLFPSTSSSGLFSFYCSFLLLCLDMKVSSFYLVISAENLLSTPFFFLPFFVRKASQSRANFFSSFFPFSFPLLPSQTGTFFFKLFCYILVQPNKTKLR